ncbi:outer membrane protein assembly factor BamB family protein [Chondromyces apiculatus]|nr:PQQ-binding-like beta-propeller repeat protein [Chondromyces apiculatus]
MYRNPPAASLLVITAVGGLVTAYERTSGRRVWTFEATRRGANHGVTLCHVEDQRVICVSAKMVDSMWAADGLAEINCLDYLTGRHLWQQEVTTGANVGYYTATVLIEAGQVLIAHNTVLFAFVLENGAFMWQQPIDGAHAAGITMPVSVAVPGRATQADRR